ncbi:unnamed protein product [Caenorhabditis nigoni]|uniref:Uncharacterized protein n=1 Tax=Caenorhabditis nigoni TaxID=1611254 RepID=A0A2G5U7Q8_9PELO|nr:hypothetical protein B9Z55_014894 [Caenorhabditis nigoni]
MNNATEMCPMELAAYQALRPAKRFTDSRNVLLDLAHSGDGSSLMVSATDVILFYDLKDGSKEKPIECKKYGVDLLEYTTDDTCAHSDTKGGLIRLLNITKNTYIRYLPGHTKRICGIKSNPQHREKFISSSEDGDVRMFDSRTFDNYGLLRAGHPPLIAFDPDGIIFATATKSETIRLFDVRSFDLGPFSVFRIMKNDDDEWTNIEFTPCGKFILVSTKGAGVKWIDAFSGKLVHNFCDHKNPRNVSLRATVTPDSDYVMVGSADRSIYIYNTETGNVAGKLSTPYPEPSHILDFNPKLFLMTTLGREVMIWTPDSDYLFGRLPER